MKLVTFTTKDTNTYVVEMKNPKCYCFTNRFWVEEILDSWQYGLLLNGQKDLVLDWDQIGRFAALWSV